MFSLKVFDKYVEIDQSYGQIIQDHQILKMIYYLSMIVANRLMVGAEYAVVYILNLYLLSVEFDSHLSQNIQFHREIG
jgi:hypothetical protein